MSSEVYERLLGVGTGDVFAGVAVGVVTNIKDPDRLGRVKLRLPWLADDVETDWARVAAPMAGKGTGAQFQPRLDDEALVAFEHGDPGTPYVIGWLWNGKDAPPEPDAIGKGNVQVLRSRSGHVVRLDDTQDNERVEIIAKGAKSSIVIDVGKQTVTITGEKDVVIEATNGKLTMRAKAGVEITSDAEIKIDGKRGTEINGGSKLTLKGGVVNIN
ncbi:phage tail protein [Frankia sp. CNm7]|uniref:Phage tail protein n=1 Tax=Frankia nepalensis TaxID=1836974 RepID=A0A937UNJ2_9ACTN|nr:phage baseplate assembly protein V [Frankia nepalensis]MBL7494827.1 phage tail protein [Frankia nepalensis]MBL7508976.1 phage tail protein [Frankia nepalensis]MBL7524784.1 phage tail protein [Frankia nepalensis]MBL7626310.1 phage tail protein [Frankia nepalensis]